ncbi:MAG: hypothetical protein GXO30_00695, partial [Epsilonproteobacteria bacterium]|nr:hypothetical protein [Campylobacterota bacterium]
MFGWLKRDKTEEVLDTKEITVDFTDFHKITDFIYEQTGITDLHSRALTPLRLKQYAQEHHIYNSDDFLNELKQKNSFYQKVIDIATVNETYFFREKKELQWLVEYIDKSQKKLKILSMPSSSGEEVYSILLMLLEKKIPLNKVEIRGY